MGSYLSKMCDTNIIQMKINIFGNRSKKLKSKRYNESIYGLSRQPFLYNKEDVDTFTW